MKPTVLALVAGLLGAMFLLQTRVIEKTEVQRLERESQNLGDLRASSLLPTYIGSLFLGSFRAVAIDLLWIQMHRMGEKEHRYFERVEIMDLITKLQPRNPEAWAYMGWDSAYNIANEYRTAADQEMLRRLGSGPGTEDQRDRLNRRIEEKDAKYRTWVRLGLLKLAEGTRHLPDDAYLKYEVGKALWTKAAWSNGILDEQFLRTVEEDPELQRILGEGLEPAGTRTAFELSEAWFAKGQETLERLIREGRFRLYRTVAESLSRPAEEERRYHTTQMGLNIDVAAFVGFISEVRYLNGILKWYRARHAEPDEAKALLIEASDHFRKAGEQAALFRGVHSLIRHDLRAFHDARADLCRGLAALCADQASLPHPLPEANRAEFLARLETIWWNPVDRNAPPQEQVPPPDERYVLDYMSYLKRSLGGDASEYNDDPHALHRGNLLAPGESADATIGPGSSDVDWYHYYAAPPAGGPASPLTAVFTIRLEGDTPVQVLAFDYHRTDVRQLDVTDREEHEIAVTSPKEGTVILRVTGPAGSRYRLTARGIRP